MMVADSDKPTAQTDDGDQLRLDYDDQPEGLDALWRMVSHDHQDSHTSKMESKAHIFRHLKESALTFKLGLAQLIY